MFLFDTNVISELRVPSRAHQNVKAWTSNASRADIYISVVTVMEIELGAVLKHRKDPLQANVFRTWLHQRILPAFEGRILPVNTQTALRWAHLQAPRTRSYRDALITATALEHGLTVVTRNVADFEGTGVGIVNPWL